ncbi:MAG: hypothetical protein QNJ42_19030 [Crocosphaera sp.]|nr:hypothetical protein [Crocosphaera sp.]
MKIIKSIVFSLFLVLCCLLMPCTALAADNIFDAIAPQADNIFDAIAPQADNIFDGIAPQADNIFDAMPKYDGIQSGYPSQCFTVGMGELVPIVIGQPEGEVDAYARAYHQPDRSNPYIERQYLAIYYGDRNNDDNVDIFQYPASEKSSPKCDSYIRSLSTSRFSKGKPIGLSWKNPKGVLLRGKIGTVECEEPVVCGDSNWYWYRR